MAPIAAFLLKTIHHSLSIVVSGLQMGTAAKFPGNALKADRYISVFVGLSVRLGSDVAPESLTRFPSRKVLTQTSAPSTGLPSSVIT